MRVVVNADDFGKSPGRNRAIDDSFRQGLISSAGLIVTGKHLGEAVDYFNKGGYVEHVHLHLNLSTNLLYEDPEDIPITDSMRKDTFFCTNGKFTPYTELPHKFSDIRKWKIAYREIVAQYKIFIEVTNGKADYKHVDFHLWYNLTYPVSVALNLFTLIYNIKSVRYIGIRQMNINDKVFKRCRLLSWNPRVRYIPATNIDYYLTKRQSFIEYKVMELYCHPNYKNGVFLDDSPSYLKHDRQPMLKQIQMLKGIGDIEFVSWENCF